MATLPHTPALPRTARPVSLRWPRRLSTVIARVVLVLLMALGSVALWVAAHSPGCGWPPGSRARRIPEWGLTSWCSRA